MLTLSHTSILVGEKQYVTMTKEVCPNLFVQSMVRIHIRPTHKRVEKYPDDQLIPARF